MLWLDFVLEAALLFGFSAAATAQNGPSNEAKFIVKLEYVKRVQEAQRCQGLCICAIDGRTGQAIKKALRRLLGGKYTQAVLGGQDKIWIARPRPNRFGRWL